MTGRTPAEKYKVRRQKEELRKLCNEFGVSRGAHGARGGNTEGVRTSWMFKILAFLGGPSLGRVGMPA